MTCHLAARAITREFLEIGGTGPGGKTPVPLLFDFRGLSGTGKQEESFDTWNKYADSQGFIVVYPDGTGNSWNAGGCCDPAATN